MVLCVEVVDTVFANAFKAFLNAGGYTARQRSSGDKEFYRFSDPKTDGFPYMIELFSRKPGTIDLTDDATLTPIPVEDDVLSLSAILLDNGYYEALQKAKRSMDGVTVIDETLLIPFKARAFLDLSERASNGDKIDSKAIKKHRNDVMRLVQLLPSGVAIDIADPIRDDLRRFLDIISADETLDLKVWKLSYSRDEAIALLRAAYSL